MKLITSAAFLILLNGVTMAEKPPVKLEVSTETESVLAGGNEFALDLYRKLGANRQENIFFSPYSVASALAMTYAGADGETKSQMVMVLHFPQNEKLLHEVLSGLRQQLNFTDDKSGFQLRVANRLWGQKGFHFSLPFLESTQTNYGAELGILDFQQTESARTTINQWVEQQTNQRIQNLLAPGSIDGMTRLVLTNAIFFKARWSDEFNKSATSNESFSIAKGQKQYVPTMHLTRHFSYGESETLQLLELPYGLTHELSMMIVLPKKVGGLADLERNLKTTDLMEWFGKMKSTKVAVHLPKFKMTSEFSLADVLSSMGMPLAFSERADFSRMTNEEQITISAVIHKAFLDVNEEGTEAAAATAIAMRALSAAPGEPEVTVPFRADHPFLFLIRHRLSNSILFLGKCENPKR